MVSDIVRRTIPAVIVFVVGMVLLAEYFFTVPVLTSVASNLRTWAVIIFGMTVLFGVLSLLRWHVSRIRRGSPGGQAFYSAWAIVMFFIFMILGFILPPRLRNPNYVMMFNAIYLTATAALWSLHGFWATLAGYRGLRARNRYSYLMLLAAVLVILGVAPWGELIWPGFVPINQWIQDTAFQPGMRVMLMTLGIGAIYFAIRTLLGYERGYMT